MRKSPFSTPRGYRGHRKYSDNFNNSYENKNYYQHKNNSFESSSPKINPEPLKSEDFIPFDTSSPSSLHEKRQSGQFFRPRGRRNNYSLGSQGSRSDGMSPKIYVDTSPSNYYDRTPRSRCFNFRSTPIDEIPISKFFDMKDALDNPWEELMEIFNKSRNGSKLNESTKTSCSSDFNNFSINESALKNSLKCSQETEDEETNAISDLSSNKILESKEIEKNSND